MCSLGWRTGRAGRHLVDPDGEPVSSAGIRTAVRKRNAKTSMRLRRCLSLGSANMSQLDLVIDGFRAVICAECYARKRIAF
jgi:hypothetical protein